MEIIYLVDQHQVTNQEHDACLDLIKVKVPIFRLGDLTLALYGFAANQPIKVFVWQCLEISVRKKLACMAVCVYSNINCKFNCIQPEFKHLVAFEKKIEDHKNIANIFLTINRIRHHFDPTIVWKHNYTNTVTLSPKPREAWRSARGVWNTTSNIFIKSRKHLSQIILMLTKVPSTKRVQTSLACVDTLS